MCVGRSTSRLGERLFSRPGKFAQGYQIMFAALRADRMGIFTVCAHCRRISITRTVVLMMGLAAAYTACRHVAKGGTMPVPSAVITVLRAGPGLESLHSDAQVEERVDVINDFLITYLS